MKILPSPLRQFDCVHVVKKRKRHTEGGNIKHGVRLADTTYVPSLLGLEREAAELKTPTGSAVELHFVREGLGIPAETRVCARVVQNKTIKTRRVRLPDTICTYVSLSGLEGSRGGKNASRLL